MIRLNLGSGSDRHEGFLSVDLRPEVADVVASVDDLSMFADGSVDELLALDLLEHFPRTEVAAVLAEWHRVLRPGGRITIRVPNMLALAQQIVDGLDVEATIENVMGGHRWSEHGDVDVHHWNFTPNTLRSTLEGAGFTVESLNDKTNMTAVAYRCE